MNRITKFLKNLPKKIRIILEKEILEILAGKIDKKDVKALSGKKGYFRVRKGNFRIIFLKKKKSINIVKIDTRNNTTYNI